MSWWLVLGWAVGAGVIIGLVSGIVKGDLTASRTVKRSDVAFLRTIGWTEDDNERVMYDKNGIRWTIVDD